MKSQMTEQDIDLENLILRLQIYKAYSIDICTYNVYAKQRLKQECACPKDDET